MVFMNLRTILSIIGAKTKTLVTAKAALQSMVAGIEGNETPDSGYLSRRDGTGGTGLGHCDIPKDLVGFEAPQGYQPTENSAESATRWVATSQCLPKYCTKSPMVVDGLASNG